MNEVIDGMLLYLVIITGCAVVCSVGVIIEEAYKLWAKRKKS